MKNTQLLYEKLLEKAKEIKVLKSICTLIDWDQETYMPPKGLSIRSTQKEHLEALIHKEFTSTQFQELLGALISLETGKIFDESGLDEIQKSALIEWRADLLKSKKLPDEFVKKFARATSEAVSEWGIAKTNNDFNAFIPHLKKIIHLTKEKAEYLGYKDHPYNALLEEYERGMNVKKLDKLFNGLKPFLIDLTKKLSQKTVNDTFLYGEFSPEKLFEFDYEILKHMGFEEGTYRLDASNHPFCLSLSPDDVRMTTVVKTSDIFAANISSVIHEAGHGLYEQGLDKEQFATPIGEFLTMGIHESQSKLWECFLGQSLSFWEYFYPKLQKQFPSHFSHVSLDTFYQAINQVKPSMIRIYADEVTYCLHVILRYEMEKGILEGSIDVEEIPDVWNKKMHEYLAITPKTHKEGCLQDIHWAWGLFGYFPTYALGNLYAAQMFHQLISLFPDWKERVSQGHLTFIKDWLHENIHRHGRRYSTEELMKRATGEVLNEEHFKKYLMEKYSI
jgi:carboxypeptidase Taq